MPRLPTIRVIGSQAISTSWPGSRFAWDGSGMIVVIGVCSLISAEKSFPALPGAVCACCGMVGLGPPARFLVRREVAVAAQAPYRRAVQARCGRGHFAARLFVHERHELVR